MNRKFIDSDSLHNFYANGRAMGYRFQVNNNRYRNIPVSCLENLRVFADGMEVDPVYIHFCVNGKKFQPSEMRDMYNEYWGMRTPAFIEVDQFDGLAYGQHEIEVKLLARHGYIEAPLCVIDNAAEPHMYPTANIGAKETLWLIS